MKIKTKFPIYFGLSLVIVSILSYLSIKIVSDINSYIVSELPQAIEIVQKASQLNTTAQIVRYYDEVLTQSARNYAFTGNTYWKDRYFQFAPKLDEVIKSALTKGNDEDRAIFFSINESNLALVNMETQAIILADGGNLEAAQALLDSSEYTEQKKIYQNGIEKYASLQGDNLDSATAVSAGALLSVESRLRQMVGAHTWLVIGMILLFFLVLLFFSYQIVKTFIIPLYTFKKTARKITDGDLSAVVNIKNDNEIGEFAYDFNKMTAAIKKTQEKINLKVKQQTQEITEKSRELEEKQKKLLVMLKEIEDEKEKTEDLAKDLEKFKLAVDNTSNHIVITDSDGIILYANKAVEGITGFKISEIIGKKAGAKELWGGLMDEKFYDLMWRTIKEDKKTFAGEVNNRRKNGEDYVALASISPILNKNKEVAFFVGIERDITKEKQVDRAKTEFVSLASHQLRTPLSIIKWYVELLLGDEAGKLNAQQKRFIKEIYDGNQRMVSLVRALLNVSRIELGTLAVDPIPTDFAKVCKDLLKEMKPLITAKKLKVSEAFDPDLPEINADPNIIRIIFHNLLTNAIKYTSEKGNIKVGLEKKANKIMISVSDTGYGIPKNQQSRIFEKLFRADNAKKKDADGNGLGLYLVKSVVAESKGEIWFESEENKGTTFFITLPLSGMRKKEGSKTLYE